MDYHIYFFTVLMMKDTLQISHPDLPGCSAFGNTPEEAVKELTVVKTAWIETAKAENISIPKPRYRPVIYS